MRPIRSLFNAAVLRREVDRHVRAGRGAQPEHLAVVRSWYDKLGKGHLRGYSETQIEQAFNAAFFVDMLGYEPFGRGVTHHIVPKRTGVTGRDTPDFVLGTFNDSLGVERWRCVGEIKSPGVDLDLPQTSRYSRESPVQQGFRYALRGQPGTEWIIVTNFSETRLYRNGFSAAFHRWTLEELCSPSRLDEFFVLLHRQHIAPDSGMPETLRILDASLSAGLKLTEGFYGLYDLARRELLAELRKQTTESDQVLYGKAHKLLNRILFAAFCEDHPAGLLPDGTLKQLHNESASSAGTFSYWNVFLDFFNQLNKGSPPGAPHAFNAFNGGLFAPDPLIDGLRLGNDLFRKTLHFSERGRKSRAMEGVFGFHVYDFAEELDVDSLGAIFEQSLKDLPYENRAVRGRGTAEVSRRESNGVYYTPKAITQFLVQRALEHTLAPEREALLKEVDASMVKGRQPKFARKRLSADETRDLMFLQSMLERLKTLTIVDPACGSGAFLVQAFEQLHSEYEAVTSALAELSSARPLFGLDRLILRNNLFGTDLLPESVEISKLSIWLRTATPSEPLEKLDTTIWAADALEATDGDHQYDIVVSNPPWGADLPDSWTSSRVRQRFPDCGVEQDTYALFMMRAWELLKPNGILSFIVPNSWLTVHGYSGLRRWMIEKFNIIELVNVWKVFSDVNHDECILVARKRPTHGPDVPIPPRPKTSVRCLTRGLAEQEKWQQLAEERWSQTFEVASEGWLAEPDARFETMYEPALARELSRVASRCSLLGDLFEVTVGIQVYHQRKVDQSIIRERAFHATHKKGPDWYPYVDANEVQRFYQVPAPNAFLLFSDQLCDKRELAHYRRPRVLVQQIFWNRLSASLVTPEGPVLYLNTLFSCSEPKSTLSLEALVVILNSRFISASYERWANRLFGDKFPKVSKLDLARLPIPKLSTRAEAQLASLGKRLGADWTDLKATVAEFFDFLDVKDSSRSLRRALVNFWELDKRAVLEAIAAELPAAEPQAVKQITAAWSAATGDVNRLWASISEAEAKAEKAVEEAYKLKGPLYDELIRRSRPPLLTDVLLPKE